MDYGIDLKKSVQENLEAKYKQCAILQEQKKVIKDKISELKKQVASLTKDDGKSRLIKGDLILQIKDLEDEYSCLDKKDNLINFVTAYQKWERSKKAPSLEKAVQETNEEGGPSNPDGASSEAPAEEDASSQTVALSLNKLKSKKKKKGDGKNMIQVKSIGSLLGNTKVTKTTRTHDESSKQLAQWLKEIPLDQKEKVCPHCPGRVVLSSMKQQPTRYCPICGFSEDIVDTTSTLIHDKETNAHTPFAYRPYFHFKNWVQFFIDEQKYTLEPEKKEKILLELDSRRITDLKNVNWEVINKILHYIASNKDRSFTDLYPHVYQITNEIRGNPIVTFSEDLKRVVFDLFHPIYKIWEPIKQKLNIDRDNFLSNPIILQIIFIFLEMPAEIISMLNMLKGEENLQMYDTIIKEICIALKREDLNINTSIISNMRYGKVKPIIASLRANEQEETPQQLIAIEEPKDPDPSLPTKKRSEPLADSAPNETLVLPKKAKRVICQVSVTTNTLKVSSFTENFFASSGPGGEVVTTKAVPSGPVADTNSAQTFVNKTLSAPNITNLGSGKVLTTNSSGVVTTDTPAPQGNFVGTTDSQVLTNKTINGATFNNPTIQGFTPYRILSTNSTGSVVASILAPNSSIVGTTDSQSILNKTIVSPVINGGTINGPSITGYSPDKLLSTDDFGNVIPQKGTP